MAWAQYCAGISCSILDTTDTKLPHLEAKWITSLRTYCNDIGGLEHCTGLSKTMVVFAPFLPIFVTRERSPVWWTLCWTSLCSLSIDFSLGSHSALATRKNLPLSSEYPAPQNSQSPSSIGCVLKDIWVDRRDGSTFKSSKEFESCGGIGDNA